MKQPSISALHTINRALVNVGFINITAKDVAEWVYTSAMCLDVEEDGDVHVIAKTIVELARGIDPTLCSGCFERLADYTCDLLRIPHHDGLTAFEDTFHTVTAEEYDDVIGGVVASIALKVRDGELIEDALSSFDFLIEDELDALADARGVALCFVPSRLDSIAVSAYATITR